MNDPGSPGDGGGGPRPWAYLSLGMELIAPILVGVLGGYWLDGKLGTRPWLVLTGALLGIAAGFIEFFRRVLPPKGRG